MVLLTVTFFCLVPDTSADDLLAYYDVNGKVTLSLPFVSKRVFDQFFAEWKPLAYMRPIPKVP